MRYRETKYGSKDEQPLIDGDPHFVGLNMRAAPQSLGQGWVSEAVNKRIEGGDYEPRKGVRLLSWINLPQPGATPNPSLIFPFGIVHGWIEFRDPNTLAEWVIVASNTGTWKCREGQSSTAVPLPPGITINTEVNFIQCFNVLLMQRGASLDTLVMTDLDEGFKAIPTPALGSGLRKIPNSNTGVAFGNRVIIPYAGDLVYPSLIGDYTEGYDQSLVALRINQGSADKLVALYKFNDTTIVCFKEQSVYLLGAVQGPDDPLTGLQTTVYLDSVTTEYGLRAKRAVAQVGNDLWFLAYGRGVSSVTQTELNKLQLVDVPVSRDLQPMIDRINWQYASGAVAAFHDNRFYLAIPVDDALVHGNVLANPGNYDGAGNLSGSGLIIGATYLYQPASKDHSLTCGSVTLTAEGYFTATASTFTATGTIGETFSGYIRRDFVGINNAVIVYNTLQKAWESVDQGTPIMVQEWRKFTSAGKIRLGYSSPDGFIYLYEDAYLDDVGAVTGTVTQQSVQDRLVTRGYLGAQPGIKEGLYAQLVLRTWDPAYEISQRFNGVAESRVASPVVTKNRLRYFKPWDKPNWDPTNVNDDFMTAGREDYSITPGVSGIDPGSGIDPNLHQEIQDGRKLRGQANFTQVVVEGTQGRVVVRSCEVEGRAGARRMGNIG